MTILPRQPEPKAKLICRPNAKGELECEWREPEFPPGVIVENPYPMPSPNDPYVMFANTGPQTLPPLEQVPPMPENPYGRSFRIWEILKQPAPVPAPSPMPNPVPAPQPEGGGGVLGGLINTILGAAMQVGAQYLANKLAPPEVIVVGNDNSALSSYGMPGRR